MRIVDLDKLAFSKCRMKDTQVVDIRIDTCGFFNLGCKDFYAQLDKDIRQTINAQQWSGKPVCFNIYLDNVTEEDDIEQLSKLCSSLLVSALTLTQERERGPRLGVPQNLNGLKNITKINWLKLINRESLINQWGGFIFADGKKSVILR